MSSPKEDDLVEQEIEASDDLVNDAVPEYEYCKTNGLNSREEARWDELISQMKAGIKVLQDYAAGNAKQ